MKRYVLDTLAVLTLLNGEAGTEVVLEVLDAAAKGEASVHMPFMTLMELAYLLLRSESTAAPLQNLMSSQVYHDGQGRSTRLKAPGSENKALRAYLVPGGGFPADRLPSDPLVVGRSKSCANST